MSSRGVLYFVWGDSCDALLERSITSLRKHHPDLPHHVVRLPANSTYLEKVRMYDESPFDVTAYLDADAMVFGNLDYGFTQAEKHGVACCINESPWLRRYEGCKGYGDANEYNAGVVFFDKVKSKHFFEEWKANSKAIDSSSTFKGEDGHLLRQRCNDQAGMGKAIADNGFHPFVLPMNWNFRPHWHRAYVGPVKIWHDYENPPQQMIDASAEADKERVFDNTWLSHDFQSPPDPAGKKVKISWAMSVPRLGFQDNHFCNTELACKRGISPIHYDGVFWGQCLERVMSGMLDSDWVLSTDYDSVFRLPDFDLLCSLMARADFADAIAGVQMKRKTHEVLAAFKSEDGKLRPEITLDSFKTDLLQCSVAHFGFTMFRVSALRKMEHPWFLNVPDEKGEWGDNKQDEDIYFWRKWKAAGNSLYLANHIPVGHIETVIFWPDENMDPIYQHPCDFWSKGKPEQVWK